MPASALDLFGKAEDVDVLITDVARFTELAGPGEASPKTPGELNNDLPGGLRDWAASKLDLCWRTWELPSFVNKTLPCPTPRFTELR